MPHRRRSTRRCVHGQLMYSPRDQAVIDAEPVGAGVDSEAVEIFEFWTRPGPTAWIRLRHILLTIR
jgi:hypothetical protein